VETIDWFYIITDLQRHGVHHEMVAARADVSRSTIINMQSHGTEPRHYVGEAVLKIWRTVTGKTEPPTKKKMTGN
jgi:hypothetical protein